MPEEEVAIRLQDEGLALSSARRVASALKQHLQLSSNLDAAVRANRQLREFGMHWIGRTATQGSSTLPLSGKTFVLTGTLPTLTKEEAKEKIEKLGGKVKGSVSSRTDYVVVGDDAGSKHNEALRLKKPILNQEQLLDLLDFSEKSGGFTSS